MQPCGARHKQPSKKEDIVLRDVRSCTLPLHGEVML